MKIIVILLIMLALILLGKDLYATEAISQYCPTVNELRYEAIKPALGKVYSTGSHTASLIKFENPYMRNKPYEGGLVPLPAYVDSNNYIEQASVNPEWETHYGEGTLICYYLYPRKEGGEEKLNMMSERGAFHQCTDGRVLPNNIEC